jgi:rRNA maturation RNase YbeY
MIQINISKQSNYPISAVTVKKFLTKFFAEHGIVSDSIVSVSFVNEAKMKELGKKYYRKDKKIHSVFSFVESEVKGFKNANPNIINLGEIIVCFPQVVKEAEKEGKLIEEKVLELIEHSSLHLLGIHHEEQ